MKYIKKPIPIDAIQWNGDNVEEILNFMLGNCPIFSGNGEITINTLEGKMNAPLGSYIIKGVDGEFYPCRREIFEASYTKIYKHSITCNQCHKKFSTTDAHIYYDELNNKYQYWAICPYCNTKNDWEV